MFFFFAIAQVVHGHFNAPTIEFANILIRLQLLFYRRCSRLPLSAPVAFVMRQH